MFLIYISLGNLLNGCKAAGGHYNPHGKAHGTLSSAERHAGDIGPVDISDGSAKIDIEDEVLQIIGPENNIIGRSVIVHESGTEGESDTGHLAGGVIGVSGPIWFYM